MLLAQESTPSAFGSLWFSQPEACRLGALLPHHSRSCNVYWGDLPLSLTPPHSACGWKLPAYTPQQKKQKEFAQNLFIGGSVHGGFQTVVRVWSGEQIPAPHFNLDLTSVLPVLTSSFLFLTSFLPPFNICSAGNLEPRFGNHGIQTLGLCNFLGEITGKQISCTSAGSPEKNVRENFTCLFSSKIIWTGGPKTWKKMPSSRYRYGDLISQRSRQKLRNYQELEEGKRPPPPRHDWASGLY